MHCKGCRECMETGECAIKDDDLDLILDRLMKAHLIVIGAPVYWDSPPGVMKDFIDRTHGFYLDHNRLSGKKVGIISVRKPREGALMDENLRGRDPRKDTRLR